MKPAVIDLDALKEQSTPLTEEQENAIRDNAFKNMQKRKDDVEDDDEEDDETPNFKDTVEPKEGKDANKGKAETEEEKAAREAEEAKRAEEEAEAEKQKLEEERLKKIEEVKAKPEDKLSAEEKALLEEHKKAEEEAAKASFEAEVEEYATEHGYTEAQARKEVEKIRSVREKYKGDPKAMAKALYHLNVKLSQASQELSQVKSKPAPKQFMKDGKLMSEEDSKQFLIDLYRRTYPDLAADLEDEKVHVLAVKEMNEKIRIAEQRKMSEQKESAEKKRESLLANLSESDKKFAKDIRGGLYRLDDSEVLDEDFDLSDLLCWAKGRRYERDIKEAVEKAKAEAIRDKKILGANGGSSAGGSSTPASKKTQVSLSKEEKERALEMYDSLQIPEDEKFKMYSDFLKKTNQK